jgi:hypothetical protein
MGKAEDEIAAVKAARAAERANGGPQRHARTGNPGRGTSGQNGGPGAPTGKRKPGPGKRWPLREWMGRETWAQLGSTAQAIFAYLCVKTDPKTGYWGHGYGAISRSCGVSTDTIGRAVSQLENNGLIQTKTKTMPCKGQPRTRVMIWIQSPGEVLDLNRMDARLPAMEPEPQECGTVVDKVGSESTGGQPCGTRASAQ